MRCWQISLAHVIIYLKTEELSTGDVNLTVQHSGTNFLDCGGKTRRVSRMPEAHAVLSCGSLEFFPQRTYLSNT